MSTHSWALSPWWFPGVPASVPMAMRTPSSWARRIVSRWISLNSTIRWRRWPGIASTIACSRNSSSPAQIVGTTNVPARAIRRNASSSANVQCSMLSTPASTALTMPWQAWAWAATGLKLSWATSTAARSSSSVYWIARESSLSDDSIAPVAITLITSAPRGELAAHRPSHFVDAVGDLVHAGVVVDRGGRDREQPAGQEQPRPGDLARVDRIADRHLDVVPPADVACGRDPRVQRALRGGCREQRDSGVRARRRGGRIGQVGGLGEVHVAVDEAGQQPAAAEVDDRVVGVGAGRRDDGGDALAVDTDVGADEPLPCGIQHLPAREPTHRSIPPDPRCSAGKRRLAVSPLCTERLRRSVVCMVREAPNVVGVYRTTWSNVAPAAAIAFVAFVVSGDLTGGDGGGPMWPSRVPVAVVVGGALCIRVLRRGVIVTRSGIEGRRLWISWRVPWSAVDMCGTGDPLVEPMPPRGRLSVTLLDGTTRSASVGGGRRQDPEFPTAIAIRSEASEGARPYQEPNWSLTVCLASGIGLLTAMAVADTGRMNQDLARRRLVSYSTDEWRQLATEIAVAQVLTAVFALAGVASGVLVLSSAAGTRQRPIRTVARTPRVSRQ